MSDSKAVYAGSFDPITLGHEWLIEQAANDYNKVVVAIAINPGKSYTFSVDQRTKMVFLSTSQFSNVEVVAVGNEYLVDFAARHNAGYILRGIRTQDDWAYELAYREFNSRREPNIQTRFYTPSP